jgi:2-phosphosulfolactate phosphatase
LYSKGVDKIYPVAILGNALAFQSPNKKVVSNGRKLPEFTFGNSPTEVMKANIKGNIVVQTTHAGTLGLVNVKATANFIKTQNPAVL